MKIQGAKKVHYDSGPNMTPLVDVVMVILIFLMLAGSFEKGGWFLQSNMPITQTGGGTTTETGIPPATLELRVDNVPGGDFRVTGGDINSTGDRGSLKASLQRKRELLEAAGSPPETVQVLLMPGRSVKYDSLIIVYEAALRAGFTKVGFSQSH